MNKSIISLAVVTALITSFTGCGSSSSSKSTDIPEYFEKNSQVKNIVNIYKDSRLAEEQKVFYQETVDVKENVFTYSVNGTTTVIITANKEDLNISIPIRNNLNYLVKRHVNVGDEISSYSISSSKVSNGITVKSSKTENCTLDAILKTLTVSSTTFEGDILRQKCISTTEKIYVGDINETLNHVDIEFTYYQKDKGQIVGEDKNCWLKHINSNSDNNQTYYVIDDTSSVCDIRTSNQTLLLE